MIDITITKIKTYEFEGTIESSLLDIDQVKELGYNVQYSGAMPNLLHITGEYSVEWDYDLAIPQISCVTVWSESNEGGRFIDLNLESLDIEGLEKYIEESGMDAEWSADKQASLIDYAYDNYRDGE